MLEYLKGVIDLEIKNWTYEEYPSYVDSTIPTLKTTGDEIGVHYWENIEYLNGDGISLSLQILEPFTRNEPEKEYPCVIFVQGSAWMKQEKYKNLPQLNQLAKRGYVCALVEYRDSSQASFPAQIIDTRNAVRYLKKHAQDYHILSEQMILMGDSSGGHTVLFAGIMHDDESENNAFKGISAEVKGIISLYGASSVMDEDSYPSTLNHHMPDSPEGLMAGGIDLKEHKDICEKISFERNVTKEIDIVPVLLIHGSKDRTVNPKQSVNVYKQLKACEKDVSFYLLDGADHGGAEFWTDQVIDIEEEFIQRCIKLG